MANTLITSTEGFAAAVRERREALGLTQADVDQRSGLADGHTGKIESFDRKWGKGAFGMTFSAEILLQTLGLALVVMPRDEALRKCKSGVVREVVQRPRGGAEAKTETRLSMTVLRKPGAGQGSPDEVRDHLECATHGSYASDGVGLAAALAGADLTDMLVDWRLAKDALDLADVGVSIEYVDLVQRVAD